MLARKPAWSWLDRLRSSKGLPVTTETDLEQFLNQNPNSSQTQPKLTPNSNSVASPNQPQPQEEEEEEEEKKWVSTLSNVLSELFVMETPNSNKPPLPKKSSRKQKNPKVCIFSEETVENSVAEVEEGEEDDGDQQRLDLSGFSRSDLVVIDTSNATSVGWKTEKVVIRKGDVWKVREMGMEGKSSVFVKKKRKLKFVEEDEDEDEDEDDESEDERKKRKTRKKKKKLKMKMVMLKKKKKKKKKKQMVLSCPASNVGDRAQSCGISPFESSPEDDIEVANKRRHPNLDQAPAKRCKYLRLSGKPTKRGSLLHI